LNEENLVADEIWGALVVALASIIGIILTQYWGYRSLKRQSILQSRTEFFQDTYKRNLTVAIYLSSINRGLDRKKNIEKIQKLVDEYPYLFTADFVVNWSKIVAKTLFSDDEMKALTKKFVKYLSMLSYNYYTETLGMNDEEAKQILKMQVGEDEDFNSEKSH